MTGPFPHSSPLAGNSELLFELALAGGGCLDADLVCGEFLQLLVARSAAGAGAIWRAADYSALPEHRGLLRSVRSWRTHSYPATPAVDFKTSDINSILTWIGERDFAIAPATDPAFRCFGGQRLPSRCVVLVLPLETVGILALLRRDRAGAAGDLEALRPLASHLAASLRGCLACAALARAGAPGAERRVARERLRAELASEIAHGLSNPLTAVLGFAELLLRREYPAERQQELLAMLQSEAKRLEDRLRAWRSASC
jgi:signal transduction histidine kinase